MELPLNTLFSAIPMPVLMVEADERLSFMNALAEEMYGKGVRGRHYVTVLRNPQLLDAIEQTMRDGQGREIRYVRTEGHRDATYVVKLTHINDGGLRGVVLVFDDQTELEQTGRMRRDFVANVSHELKTPLTAMMGFIETLKGPARDDAKARGRFLDIMETEGHRMNRLVSDLLSLNRVENEERQRPMDRVDLAALLQSTALSLSPLAENSHVDVRLSGVDTPCAITGDKDQLTQVFTNLIENAIKYGGAGGVVEVNLTQSEREVAFRGPAVRVEVIDHGEGFDPVHIPRLTERFYRVDSHRSREKGGTGLGLAIVKHIINRHRGRFQIDSQIGQGARFTVLLPKG